MKKILVIRFSSIGDIVLTTPVVRCLKLQLKEAEIHFLTRKAFLSILEENPYIDRIHAVDKGAGELTEKLKQENFDFIVDLHHNLRSLQVKRKLKTSSSSFPKLNVEKWLAVHLKSGKLPGIHVVDRYMETVKALGVVNDGMGLDYFIPAKDEVSPGALPRAHQEGFIGFVIGAAHSTKRLPVEKIISICKKLNRPIILLGGKEDMQHGEEIVKGIDSRPGANLQGNDDLRVYNACGKYNLNQSASLLKMSRAVVTHDTGLMHISAALRKPVISVWGNTVPEFGMTPYYGSSKPDAGSLIVEVKNLKCRPCSKIGFSKCPKRHFRCMNEIDEEKIISGIELLAP